jgi:2-succinyl-5-enolpyruvyl-6-hydroxy-3-cyclohexene-1-carboxylate synthase
MGLTDVFFTTATHFLETLASINPTVTFDAQKQKNYFSLWNAEERRVMRTLTESLNDSTFTELSVVKSLLENLPDNSNLHLANSMSVRYGNFIGVSGKTRDVRVFANRGTSGIDGSTSTAVGHSLVSGRPNFLVTGDLAFFYDRNAFWHNYPLENLRILLLNNHGGLIFDILEGPSSTPEASDYFITRQKLNAQKLCEEFGFTYLKADHPRKLKNLFKDYLTFDSGPKILELETSAEVNKDILERVKSKIKNSYE